MISSRLKPAVVLGRSGLSTTTVCTSFSIPHLEASQSDQSKRDIGQFKYLDLPNWELAHRSRANLVGSYHL